MADDAPVASLPVYLASALPPGARLELFQYPLYARGRPLPVPASAAQRGQRITSRWRPRADRVELDMPLDMREAVYDQARGAEMGEGAARLGTIGTPEIKQEHDAPPPRLDRIRLESSTVPNMTRYMIGTVHNGALHLSPLHSVLQLRPSMQHVDAMHEAADAERRRDDDDERARGVVSLNVAVRTDGSSGSADVLAAQREAEAERWINMAWADADSAEAQEGRARLLASNTTPLYCASRAQDYL